MTCNLELVVCNLLCDSYSHLFTPFVLKLNIFVQFFPDYKESGHSLAVGVSHFISTVIYVGV